MFFPLFLDGSSPARLQAFWWRLILSRRKAACKYFYAKQCGNTARSLTISAKKAPPGRDRFAACAVRASRSRFGI